MEEQPDVFTGEAGVDKTGIWTQDGGNGRCKSLQVLGFYSV